MKKIAAWIAWMLLFLGGMAQSDGLFQETKLDQVYQLYNLSGEGVIVALIERGIDYRHPDFIDENGDTRIAYIFDMVDPSGANDPNNPYGIGTIYDRATIDQALDSGNELATMDRFGHGTACTGIAAGDGSAVSGMNFQGVAPKATIIAVEVLNDGFPAINNIAGQTGFYDPSYIAVALQFVKDKSIELGLPSVSLMNFGSIGGPTDGSSEICRVMDEFVAPGRLLVCGVGDDGGGDNRAGGVFSQGVTTSLQFRKATAGNLRMELWYGGEDRIDVSITRPNGTMLGPLAGPATNQSSTSNFPGDLNFYHRGGDQDFSASDNGQRQILIDFFGDTGTYTVDLITTTINQGSWHASLNPAIYNNENGFLNHIETGKSINDFAAAFRVITPTDYVLDNSWTDLNGIARGFTGQGNPGELWVGSSAGPTIDGRLGVDVAVPGEVLFGAYSADTYYSQFPHLLVQGGNGHYGVQNAVSAAAPVLTGVLALMLEVNGNLDDTLAKELLQSTAVTDAFTGTTPNAAWGYGKLDALAAIEATQQTVGLEVLTPSEWQLQVFPNPTSDQVRVQWDQQLAPQLWVQLWDLSGRLMGEQLLVEGGEVSLADHPPGIYVLTLDNGEQQTRIKLVKQ